MLAATIQETEHEKLYYKVEEIKFGILNTRNNAYTAGHEEE